MTGPQKRKGDAFERDVRDFLRAHGHPFVERCFGAGRRDDQGDILGIPGIVISCKDCTQQRMDEWLDQVEVQRVTARALFGVVVHKRRRKPIGQSKVTMDLETFARLVD